MWQAARASVIFDFRSHTNLGTPNSDVQSPSAGQITGLGGGVVNAPLAVLRNGPVLVRRSRRLNSSRRGQRSAGFHFCTTRKRQISTSGNSVALGATALNVESSFHFGIRMVAGATRGLAFNSRFMHSATLELQGSLIELLRE